MNKCFESLFENSVKSSSTQSKYVWFNILMKPQNFWHLWFLNMRPKHLTYSKDLKKYKKKLKFKNSLSLWNSNKSNEIIVKKPIDKKN